MDLLALFLYFLFVGLGFVEVEFFFRMIVLGSLLFVARFWWMDCCFLVRFVDFSLFIFYFLGTMLILVSYCHT